MTILGKQLINGEWQAGNGGSFNAVNPATAEQLEPQLTAADEQQVDAAVAAATEAATAFANTSLKERGDFLYACAEEIMALGDELLERLMAETGYPRARVEGERGRTCNQLKLFADTIQNGEYLDARIDLAMPDRQPAPRPDIRFFNQALGPVAVFGASNFPMAFSTAGGDTASALAAGCPVVVKGHNSHAGSAELVAQAINTAVKKCNLPAAVFSYVIGEGRRVGARLVQADGIKAVGFTGSYGGGMALFKLANERKHPIPVFAEMGSINPVVLLPKKLKEEAEQVADGFVGSLNMGVGQFCVNPGLVIAIDSPELEQFIAQTTKQLKDQAAGVMLNQGIAESFTKGASELASQPGVETLVKGQEVDGKGFCGQAQLFSVAGAQFVQNKALQEEVFGPSSLIVKCKDRAELLEVLSHLGGQLTGTLFGADGELQDYQDVVTALQHKVGRVVFNNYPTGVEVCHAMMHGGPSPASTDARFTSVGTKAIDRFVRPVCFQNFPADALPAALKDENPWGISRLINGERTSGKVEG